MDLNVMINDTLTKMKEEGYVEKVVKTQLESTIEGIMSDALRKYSDFGKELEKQVEEQLQVNLKNLDLPSYNQIILNTVNEELERSIHDVGVKKMQENLQKLLGTSEEEYKLSNLIKKMVDEELELHELDYEAFEEITVHVETRYGTTYISFDPEEDVSEYRCKYRIALDETGTVIRVEIADTSFDNKVIMGGLYGLNAILFKMWTRKSKLIIDSYETEFSNPEYE